MRIGVVGVGHMGGAMAERLLACGHAVTVRDIDPAREAALAAIGAGVAASPAALAAASELVIIAVVDAAQTQAVLFGGDGVVAAADTPSATDAARATDATDAAGAAGAAGDADATGAAGAARHAPAVLLCPTIAPGDVERFAAGLAAAGLACLDAPMSGGPARARDGTMSLMVACDEAAWARWRPLLVQLAQRLFRVGTRPGDGARTKLVNNLLAAIHLTASAEVLALATRLGLDAATTLAVVEQSSGQSWIGAERAQRWLAGDTAPRAHMSLLAKDAGLALAEARAAGLPQPLGERAAAAFAAACAAGLSEADDSALLDFVRARLAAG
jgi:L-threonate 2-dehydrogenase